MLQKANVPALYGGKMKSSKKASYKKVAKEPDADDKKKSKAKAKKSK